MTVLVIVTETFQTSVVFVVEVESRTVIVIVTETSQMHQEYVEDLVQLISTPTGFVMMLMTAQALLTSVAYVMVTVLSMSVDVLTLLQETVIVMETNQMLQEYVVATVLLMLMLTGFVTMLTTAQALLMSVAYVTEKELSTSVVVQTSQQETVIVMETNQMLQEYVVEIVLQTETETESVMTLKYMVVLTSLLVTMTLLLILMMGLVSMLLLVTIVMGTQVVVTDVSQYSLLISLTILFSVRKTYLDLVI